MPVFVLLFVPPNKLDAVDVTEELPNKLDEFCVGAPNALVVLRANGFELFVCELPKRFGWLEAAVALPPKILPGFIAFDDAFIPNELAFPLELILLAAGVVADEL